MPTFPTYRGELPACLNPRNLRHYLLLIYWVYFRPTALKCYLYQADPKLYHAERGLGIFQTWRVLAYRNLYLMVTPTVLLLSLLVGLPVVLTASWIQGTPIGWLGWLAGVTFGIAGSVAFSIVTSVAFGLAGGVAISIAGGVAFGIAIGVAIGVVAGVAIGVTTSVATGVATGVAFGGVAFGMTFGATFGVAFSVAFGVIFAIGEGVAFGEAVAFGVGEGVAFGVAGGVGSLRIPFYPCQLVFALRRTNQRVRHPLA